MRLKEQLQRIEQNQRRIMALLEAQYAPNRELEIKMIAKDWLDDIRRGKRGCSKK